MWSLSQYCGHRGLVVMPRRHRLVVAAMDIIFAGHVVAGHVVAAMVAVDTGVLDTLWIVILISSS